ncbi:MAG: flagellar basal-body rod protein FlgB [Deltaproteobacteria bacterium RBG_19FT_COMBO_58_16]|nr:MAG: flagellar basal-body rod protein FlgB [Deltaproteobacteria bacterium RBG_19FT_COMBO_58_16]
MKSIFNSTINLLENTLDLRASRHRLLQSNIANQETPGYRAKDINFEQELKRVSSPAGAAPEAFPGTGMNGRTNSAHIPVITERGMAPRVIERSSGIEGFDSNSVGVEGEMVKLSENTLKYNISAKMLKGRLNMIMTAIKEGGR